MINTKSLVVNVSSVPSYWAFQYYLKLSETLNGQDLKIRSIWNPIERTPSMCIYVDKQKQCYMYKDFSTGKGGNKINLLRDMFDLNYSEAVERLINDYNHYVKKHGTAKLEFKPQSKWEIEFVKTRPWNQSDAQYWLQFRIGSSMLNEYNVRPIDYYNLVKEEDGKIQKKTIRGKHMYGYYNKHNEVFKIYQPFRDQFKFYKVGSYIQGIDQLKYNQPYLVICSSLKDAMCLKGFGYNLEVIAPDSENTMIKPYIIENLKEKYEKIITLFDNDEAGKKAIDAYAKAYDINGTALTICKDISDAIKEHGFKKVHEILKPLLKETIHK
jgi:hypothetical protein